MSSLTRMARILMSRMPSWARGLLLAPPRAAPSPDGAPPAVQPPAVEPPAPHEVELRRNLHLTVVHGIFNSAAINMVGPFSAIFAMRIGASPLHVAMITSAPAIASLLAMIPGARAIDRSDRKKHLTARFILASRLFYVLLACVPFFPGPSRPTVFVTLLALMNVPGAISNVAWQAFMSRIVPPEHRANTIAARNRLMSVVGTALALIVGVFLDNTVFPLGYQVAFVAAFAVSLAELSVFRRMREPETPRPARAAGAHLGFRAILSERRFVRYTLVSMLFYLAWQIPWPLYAWYQVRILHANNLWVSVFGLLNTSGALLGYGFWSRLMNRWGNLRSLFASTLPIFVTSLAYAFSSQLYTIAAANLVVGVVFSGVNMALFNTLLEMTPDEDKTSYIAYFNTAVTLSAIAAPLLGVGLLQLMSFKAAFLVTAAIRLGGSLCYYALYRAEKRGRAPGRPPREKEES